MKPLSMRITILFNKQLNMKLLSILLMIVFNKQLNIKPLSTKKLFSKSSSIFLKIKKKMAHTQFPNNGSIFVNI